MFEKIKHKSNVNHFSSMIQKHQHNSKETWKVMKEAIGKSKILQDDFPRTLLKDKQEISNKSEIVGLF